MEEEELTLVTRESQLFVGALVKVFDCVYCGRTHTTFLLGQKSSTHVCVLPDGKVSPHCFRPSRCWRLVPCYTTNHETFHFCRTIRERRLFIVKTGLKAEENPYKMSRTRIAAERAKEQLRL